MAYTAVAQQAVAGPNLAESATAKLTTVTFTAIDATNGNEVIMSTGRTLLIVQNTDASAGTVTITSSPDPYGRTATITAFSVAAGAFAARIFEPVGWEATAGGRNLVIAGSAATMKFLAIPL
jgi:hypothetical protein